MNNKVKLYNSARYPTSLIIRGADELGIEIAKSLLEQGGYVIIVDNNDEHTEQAIKSLSSYKLLTVLDYTSIEILETDLRRLDYVFYFQNKASNLNEKISSQEFLQHSNYLDSILDLATKFEARFLLTTSIKAHQLNVSSKQLDSNYTLDNDDKHTTYTEIEVQRYSESLVREYQEKVKLDARIIRLGILLGRAFNPEDKSVLYELISNAIKGQDLVIPGDGLDYDYYIHYLDAAYGLIKAQFTTNTDTKIYTLSNEEQISLLSIAYKLVEIVPTAKEIRFDNEDNELPPLKLYKPAPNLSEIGWKPRISFDRALAQTIEEIMELYNSEKMERFIIEKNKGIVLPDNDLSDDALARVVNERKVQDKARTGSIIMANKTKKDNIIKIRNKGIFKRVDNLFNNILFTIKHRMGMFKNMTVMDFFAWSLIIIAFIIIYFVLISPSVVIIRNIQELNRIEEGVKLEIQKTDYKNARISITNAALLTNEIQERLSDIRYIFNIFNKDDDYNLYQKTFDNYNQYVEGMRLTLDSLIPFQEYSENFKPDLTYRYSDNSILTVGNSTENDTYLYQIKNKYNSFKIGLEKMLKSSEFLKENLALLPDYAKNLIVFNIKDNNTNLNKFSEFASFYAYFSSIMGYQNTRNYLFILQDNSRYSSGGGEIAGYIVIQIKNGAIKDIRIKNANIFLDEKISINKDALDEIKLVSIKLPDLNSANFRDIQYITNQRLLLKEIQSIVSTKENIKIDITSIVNLKYLEALISLYGSFEYNSEIYNREDLLAKLSSGTETTDAYNVRNEKIINLFAVGLEKALNSFNTTFNGLFSQSIITLLENDFRFYSNDPLFSALDNNIDILTDYSNSDFIFTGLNSDQKIQAIKKYPVETFVAKITIFEDLSTTKEIAINTTGANESLQNTYLCIPPSSKNLSLPEVAEDIVTRTYSNDKVCYTFLKNDDYQYFINYGTSPSISISADKIYKLILFTTPGLSTNYDIEFEFSPNLGKIEPVDDNFIIEDGKYIYSGRGNGVKIFNFKIIKGE